MCYVDVVKAYKSLTKEKEALEASLKALSRTKPASRQTSTQKRHQKGSSKKEGQENESDTGRSETESDVPLSDALEQVGPLCEHVRLE